jgi:hypothetical protein
MYESAFCQAMICFCFSGFWEDSAQGNPVGAGEAVDAPRVFFLSWRVATVPMIFPTQDEGAPGPSPLGTGD